MTKQRLRPIQAEPLTVLAMGIASIAVIVLALRLGGTSGTLPLIIGSIMALCTLLYGLIGPVRDSRNALVTSRDELVFAALIGALLVATPRVGFLLAAWLYVALLHGYMTYAHKTVNWLRGTAESAVVATVVLAIIYVAFIKLLQIRLP